MPHPDAPPLAVDLISAGAGWFLPVALGGAAVLGVAAVHGRLTRTAGLSGPLVALLLGVAAGPAGLGWVDPAAWGSVKEVMGPAALVTLAVGLMGTALRLPRRCVLRRDHLVTAATLLGPGMLLAWVTAAALAWACLGLDGWAAALVGAAVVPTDPVLASAIVSGPFAREHLPGRVRHAISFESGANDGLAVPLVALAVAGVGGALATADGWGGWLTGNVLWEATAAAFVGFALGRTAAWGLAFGESHHAADETGTLAYGIALTAAVLGLAGLLGLSEPLTVFAAGLAFAWNLPGNERREEGDVQDAVNEFCLQPVFLLFGALLPWGGWADLGWGGATFAVLALLLKRPPWVWAMGAAKLGWLPDLPDRRDRLFAGWFGPVGVAALFYAAEFGEELPALWPAVSLTVALSTALHGATAAPLTRAYARFGVSIP